jgi:hypothetical protein
MNDVVQHDNPRTAYVRGDRSPAARAANADYHRRYRASRAEAARIQTQEVAETVSQEMERLAKAVEQTKHELLARIANPHATPLEKSLAAARNAMADRDHAASTGNTVLEAGHALRAGAATELAKSAAQTDLHVAKALDAAEARGKQPSEMNSHDRLAAADPAVQRLRKQRAGKPGFNADGSLPG